MVFKMSCKEKTNSKNKHYTQTERKVFLQILQDYKHVIEAKKSDSATIKDKGIAWNEINIKYNQSALICQERTTEQLKKLWANLKQTQREALTKEKQSQMATGGGPHKAETNIDPDIANIAPHLMKTAPCLFSSNMTETAINDKCDAAFEIISTDESIEELNDEIDLTNPESDIGTVHVIGTFQDTPAAQEQSNWEPTTLLNTDYLYPSNKDERKSNIMKHKRKNTTELSNVEENIRIERIREIMKQEQHLSNITSKHEERMAIIKEEHLREYNSLQIKHLKEIQELELDIKQAKLRAIKKQFLEKENIDPHV